MSEISYEEFLQNKKQSAEENQARFMESEYAVALLQLKEDAPERRDIAFESFEDAVRNAGKEPDISMYDVVYAEETDREKLEEIGRLNSRTSQYHDAVGDYMYEKMNFPETRPTTEDGYYGTSASISDVVLIKEQKEITALYIDRKGFQEIENFMTGDSKGRKTPAQEQMK